MPFRAGSLKWRPAATSAMLVAALLLAGCAGGGGGGAAAQAKPTAAPVAIPITAEPVARTDIQQTAAFSGSVTATGQISVLPQASGKLQNLYVEVGRSVNAGDVVAELDSSSAQIAVQQQQASVMAAEASLNKVLAGP